MSNVFKRFSINQTLLEKEFSLGKLGVYHTNPFGMMITLNDEPIISECDGFFYYEMMAHPALFLHTHPKKIAIMGHAFGILPEVIKHPQLETIDCVEEENDLYALINSYLQKTPCADERVTYQASLNDKSNYDIITLANYATNNDSIDFTKYANKLSDEGIFVTACTNLLLFPEQVKPLTMQAKTAGFNAWQVLHFPQASSPFGMRSLFLAKKGVPFKRICERNIFNRSFATRYYNYDVHQAALVIPEFMREMLG